MNNPSITDGNELHNPKAKKELKAVDCINYAVAGLVLSIAGMSLAMSYNALRLYGEAFGITGNFRYVFPFLIDLPLVVFSGAVVNAKLRGRKAYKEWALVGFYTIVTIAYNVLHSIEVDTFEWSDFGMWQTITVAIIAPVSLFLAFETLMSQLRETLLHNEAIDSVEKMSERSDELSATIEAKTEELSATIDAGNKEIETLTAKRGGLASDIVQLKIDKKGLVSRNVDDLNDIRTGNKTARQAVVLEHLEGVSDKSDIAKIKKQLAADFSVTPETIGRDIKALNGQLSNPEMSKNVELTDSVGATE